MVELKWDKSTLFSILRRRQQEINVQRVICFVVVMVLTTELIKSSPEMDFYVKTTTKITVASVLRKERDHIYMPEEHHQLYVCVDNEAVPINYELKSLGEGENTENACDKTRTGSPYCTVQPALKYN